MAQEQRGGLVLEMRAGDAVALSLKNGVDSEPIILILEQKDGRKARLRIKASPAVKVGKPERALA